MMLAHPLWSTLRGLVDGVNTRAEWENRVALYRIRDMERRGVMEIVGKAEGVMDVMESLGSFADQLGTVREEAAEGKTDTLRTMFGNSQVDALISEGDDDG